ncbi:LacI family DNA-binding transcriptional regulator [Rathayibacter oskolensis]|nr:LacI family DNA-binding transcriptional regulator [Rathayibacter oskolensis]WKK72520.1 LacI family DNA-binding transcriptional regulator [Rathayibacter oskolensis]
MADVGRRADVSAQTVSRFFTGGYVAPATRVRIEAAIADLGYRHNRVARNLRVQRTDTVGFLAMGPLNYGHSELLTGVSRAARAEGLSLITALLEVDPHEPTARLEMMHAVDKLLSFQVDGIIVGTPYEGLDELVDYIAASVPVVTRSERGGPPRTRPTPTPTAPATSAPATSSSWGTGASCTWPGRATATRPSTASAATAPRWRRRGSRRSRCCAAANGMRSRAPPRVAPWIRSRSPRCRPRTTRSPSGSSGRWPRGPDRARSLLHRRRRRHARLRVLLAAADDHAPRPPAARREGPADAGRADPHGRAPGADRRLGAARAAQLDGTAALSRTGSADRPGGPRSRAGGARPIGRTVEGCPQQSRPRRPLGRRPSPSTPPR